MFVYHFVDPDLSVEIFLENKGPAENRGVDFKIGDISTSTRLYWRCRDSLVFCQFLATKWLLKALRKEFSVFLGQTGWELQKTIVSSKAVPKNLNMKYRSEFKHGFTNHSCLHCAILKALHGFKEKSANKARDMQFFLQNVQMSRF